MEFSSSVPKGRNKATSAPGVDMSGLRVVVNLDTNS